MLIPYAVDVPMARLPWANWALIAFTIAISVSVWLGAWDAPDVEEPLRFPDNMGNKENFDQIVAKIRTSIRMLDEPPAGSLQPRQFHFSQLVTHIFVHLNVLHLLGNMFFLFAFANAVNAKLGHLPFLGTYLLAGFAAGSAWLLIGEHRPALGASGAIMGIVGVFFIFFPRNDVLFWGNFAYRDFGTFYVPAYYVISFYLVADLLGVIWQHESGIGYVAHLGGALTGITLAIVLVTSRVVRSAFGEENLLQTLGVQKRRPSRDELDWQERRRRRRRSSLT